MEKQEIIDQINKVKQQNKKYLLEIVKKKFLKQKYEPIDYIDAVLKGKDTFKEINKNDLKKIELNPYPLFAKYVQKYTESNIYSNRYRSLISKIIKLKIKKIDEKKFEKECSKLFLSAHKNILKKSSVVKNYLTLRKCTNKMIKKYKLGTNEFFKLDNILKPNIFFNIRKDINFFKEYEAVTFPSLTGFGGFRIVNKNVVQVFKYFFLRPREDLYGYIESKNDNILCLCEGIFDAIALNQIGFKNCISFGSCCPSYLQLDKVEKIIKKRKIKKIYLGFDSDTGGIIASKEIMKKFSNFDFYHFKLDGILTDPYEYFIEEKKKKYSLIPVKDESYFDKNFIEVIDFVKKYSFK